MDSPQRTPTIAEIMRAALATQEERTGTYQEGHYMHAAVLGQLFPEGLHLESHDDIVRFIVFNNIITKVVRYATQFTGGGHQDSARDGAVYFNILEAVDARISNGR